jgi:hypothetical protein
VAAIAFLLIAPDGDNFVGLKYCVGHLLAPLFDIAFIRGRTETPRKEALKQKHTTTPNIIKTKTGGITQSRHVVRLGLASDRMVKLLRVTPGRLMAYAPSPFHGRRLPV